MMLMMLNLTFPLFLFSSHHHTFGFVNLDTKPVHRRENARYLELVESGRSFQKMEERKRNRREAEAGAGGAPTTSSTGGGGVEARPGVGDAHRRIRRRFKQSSPVADVGGGGKGGMDSAVLRSVFGEKKAEGRREDS